MAYASTAELKLYRGIATASTKDDSLIAVLLGAAQKQIEVYCGRVFEAATTAVTKYFDAIRDITDDGVLLLDDDLASITAIENGDGTAVTTADYATEPRNRTPYWGIKLKTGASQNWTYEDDAENAIEVKGRWAYSTSAPADIKQATIRLAAYLYAQKDSQVFDVTAFPDAGMMTIPKGMPEDVKQILEPYRRLR